MFAPQRPSIPVTELSKSESATNLHLALHFSGQIVAVGHDDFTIGSSRLCNLTLDDPAVAALHSRIHTQGGATWIEAADQALVTVNDRAYRRMALRHDDRIRIGATEFKVLLTSESVANIQEPPLEEDLSLLTAEELCDRIVSEQSMVEEFVSGQRAGWEALLNAIESERQEPQSNHENEGAVKLSDDASSGLDNLLEQIQGLNQEIEDRTRELTDHEKEVLQSTSMIEQSNMRAVQQLDEILDKLGKSDPPGELRASA